MTAENSDISPGPGLHKREFLQLHRRTQIGLLRQLAGVALAAYDISPVRMTLLSTFSNTTFRIDTTTERYVLRIHRTGTPTVETVGSELAWLATLRRDTSLEVPSPMPTRTGTLLTMASTQEIPTPQICVLFRWMPGRLLRRTLTPAHLQRVGEFMAQLQNHSTHWQRPPGFTRGRVDWPIDAGRWLPDPFAPKILASIRALVAETLSAEEASLVISALERIRAAEQALGRGPDAFGLIHADMHYRNLLFEGTTVRAIDFDDCGFGPFLYDPAVMLSAIVDWPNYPALRAALLAGYHRVRPLSVEHEAYVDTFIALRQIQDALWVLQSREHPVLGEDWAGVARSSLTPVPTLLGENTT